MWCSTPCRSRTRRLRRVEHEVEFTSLDKPLFDGADATKGDLVAYLEAVADQLIGQLRDRPLSVMRARPGQRPFMQKNVPKNAPDWIETVGIWAERSKREVHYALCNDRSTLRWFANQRAVEYHPTLWPDPPLVLDLDPPEGAAFAWSRATALLVREALAVRGAGGRDQDERLQGGAHLRPGRGRRRDDRRGDPRARRAGGGARPVRWRPSSTSSSGARARSSSTPPVRAAGRSSPPTPRASARACRSRSRSSWDELERISPADFTIRTAPDLLAGRDPWAGVHARAADAAGGPGRRGPRHPGRPRRGDARGQATQARGRT